VKEVDMVKYYLSHQGEQVGPWSYDEIVKQLNSKKVEWTDYIFDEKQNDWVLLAEHSLLSDYFSKQSKKSKGKADGVVKINSNQDKEWFVLKGENKYGPFGYLELVKMLQEKNLYDYDYIWNAAMVGWKRVSDCEDFSMDKIRALHSSKNPESEEIFYRRRHERVKYGASVLVHNSKSVWKGLSVELSSGGAGLIIDNQSLELGHNLFLHFKVGDEVPPFNAICSVVSKQVGENNQVKYGVKFTNISRDVKHAIKAYVEKAA
jgi:hypothetical protein